MKQYVMSFAAAIEHKPEHPERTARRNMGGGLNFDVVFGVFTNRAAMLKAIEMQQRRERQTTDWAAIQR